MVSLVGGNRLDRQKPSVECPDCGSPRTAKLGGGRANDGSIPLRYRRCRDCGHSMLTAEVVIPGYQTASPFDESFRKKNREYKRRIQGYNGGTERGGTRAYSDRLDIRVRVIPGKRRGYAA